MICQRKYAENALKKFDMLGCKLVDTPSVVNKKLKREDDGRLVDTNVCRSFNESLLDLIASRPDSMFANNLLSRFMSKPSHLYLWGNKKTAKVWNRDLGVKDQIRIKGLL